MGEMRSAYRTFYGGKKTSGERPYGTSTVRFEDYIKSDHREMFSEVWK
jgi:hypothetical protein